MSIWPYVTLRIPDRDLPHRTAEDTECLVTGARRAHDVPPGAAGAHAARAHGASVRQRGHVYAHEARHRRIAPGVAIGGAQGAVSRALRRGLGRAPRAARVEA